MSEMLKRIAETPLVEPVTGRGFVTIGDAIGYGIDAVQPVDGPEQTVEDVLRRILAAMREPTDAMLVAGIVALDRLYQEKHGTSTEGIWRAMVDEALKT